MRIRVGDYRVLYIVDDAAKEVWVHNVAQRREVYDRSSAIGRTDLSVTQVRLKANVDELE